MTHRIQHAIILASLGVVLAQPARADLGLLLESDFPATAYIDGHRAGPLPLQLDDIPPGRHVVALRLPTGAGRIWSITAPANFRLEKSLRFSWQGTDLVGAAYPELPPPPPGETLGTPPLAEPEVDSSLAFQPMSSTTTASATAVDENAPLLPIGVEATFEPFDALDYPIFAYVFIGDGCGYGFRPIRRHKHPHPPHPPRPPTTVTTTGTPAKPAPPTSITAPGMGSPVMGTPVFGSPVFGSPVLGAPVIGATYIGAPVMASTYIPRHHGGTLVRTGGNHEIHTSQAPSHEHGGRHR